MKRYFQPIEKDGPFKKPSVTKASEETNDNDIAAVTEDKGTSKKEPSKFLTWNANSLFLRIKNDWAEFSKFVEQVDPDVIAIQEVRLPAAGSKGAAKNPRELKDDTNSSREEKRVTSLNEDVNTKGVFY